VPGGKVAEAVPVRLKLLRDEAQAIQRDLRMLCDYLQHGRRIPSKRFAILRHGRADLLRGPRKNRRKTEWFARNN
jgi:hypothetical protein